MNDADFDLLQQDKYTFNVLARILRGECDLIVTDHEKLIICHSDTKQGYPVWVWTPDSCGEADLERAWEEVNACRSVKDGYKYNLKYELADYFMRRAAETGTEMETVTNLFAYDCPEIIAPENKADGMLHCITDNETEEAVAHRMKFHEMIGEPVGDREKCEAQVRELIEQGSYFFWLNGEGNPVGSCGYRISGDVACVNAVLTLPEYRRRHYAQNMVYALTKLLVERGFTPMLYTDADYAASNACYQKIGYVRRGGLCTIRKKK